MRIINFKYKNSEYIEYRFTKWMPLQGQRSYYTDIISDSSNNKYFEIWVDLDNYIKTNEIIDKGVNKFLREKKLKRILK